MFSSLKIYGINSRIKKAAFKGGFLHKKNGV